MAQQPETGLGLFSVLLAFTVLFSATSPVGALLALAATPVLWGLPKQCERTVDGDSVVQVCSAAHGGGFEIYLALLAAVAVGLMLRVAAGRGRASAAP
ncbi:hypothetical protein C7Y72_00005 [Paraconexibacter algicola]|uniref:Uncharacterized protein n=1 Tax=Paraconexibacter algicola TaxID=2133960 RepID=A0A2T4UFZ7_9ACTN|nr:hypothetical protein C7Y72_00005 [Paraconexibacter algicola]